MNNHRIIAVSFLDPKPITFEFVKWPNHITIVPYFQTLDIEKITSDIDKACSDIKQIPYKVGRIDYFGIEKDVKVSKIESSTDLSRLHMIILEIALKNDEGMDVRFCNENYKPHITHNNQPHPQEGDEDILKEVYLVENFSPIEEKKKIIAVINLKL